MAIRTLRHAESLDAIWEELVYTEARLMKDEHAKDLAAHFASLLKRWEKVQQGQRAAWREEIVAQAWVDAEDDALDDTVETVGRALLAADGYDRKAPRFKRYFPKAPNAVMRFGLESELALVRAWPDSLRGEREDELQALGPRVARDVQDGEAAVAARTAAAAGRADHRVREIVRFVDDVNGARRSAYGELIQRAQKKGLPADWPSRFFRRGSYDAPARPPAGPAEPAPPNE